MSEVFSPRIFFHPGVFLMGKYTGISRYICELLEQFERLGAPFSLPLRETDNGYLPRTSFFERTARETPVAPLITRFMVAMGQRTRKREAFAKLAMRAAAREAFKQQRFNLIHPTHTNEVGLLDYMGDTPLVITIHDMIHEIMPEAFAPGDPTAERKKLFAQRADRIIAISQKTKDDIVSTLGISPDKIDVVHHGCSQLPLPAQDDGRGDLPPRYLLFVGHRAAYKNFDLFLTAVAPLLRHNGDLYLLCVGGGAWTPAERQRIDQLGLANRIRQLYADDALLARLYCHAEAFVFPSYYEGFGLPILEAFCCGAPVICARASCFEEIGGDACAYFDPHEADSMTEVVASTIADGDTRQRMILRGRERAAGFTWEQAARDTLACYQRALNERAG